MVTGLTVSYNDKALLEGALFSIRQFYPDMMIIIVDGSPEGECREFIKGLEGNYHKEFFDYNISHGRGLAHGIKVSPTDHVLCFDTDIIMNSPCINQMMELMDDETWGIGMVIPYSQNTYNVELERKGDMKYMYPHFHIINRNVYDGFEPYVHSGGPGQLVFIDMFIKEQEWRLKHFPVDDYVTHKQGGTSKGSKGNRKSGHMDNWVIPNTYYWEKGLSKRMPL